MRRYKNISKDREALRKCSISRLYKMAKMRGRILAPMPRQAVIEFIINYDQLAFLREKADRARK